jgi:hypothetical protein
MADDTNKPEDAAERPKRTYEYKPDYAETVERADRLADRIQEDDERIAIGENRLTILTEEIEFYKARLKKSSLEAATAVLELGKRLAEVRSGMDYGQWFPYLADRKIKKRTAQLYIQMWKGGVKSATIARFGFYGALKQLHQRYDPKKSSAGKAKAKSAASPKDDFGWSDEPKDTDNGDKPEKIKWLRPRDDNDVLRVRYPGHDDAFAYVWYNEDYGYRGLFFHIRLQRGYDAEGHRSRRNDFHYVVETGLHPAFRRDGPVQWDDMATALDKWSDDTTDAPAQTIWNNGAEMLAVLGDLALFIEAAVNNPPALDGEVTEESDQLELPGI